MICVPKKTNTFFEYEIYLNGQTFSALIPIAEHLSFRLRMVAYSSLTYETLMKIVSEYRGTLI